MKVKYRKELDLISEYLPGKPMEQVRRELGLERVIKLASNENPFGFSDCVREAVLRAVEDINAYPDGSALQLKEKIAKKYGIDPHMVLPASGADEMLDLIAKTFIEQGSQVILAEVTFPRYLSTSLMMGADLQIVPLVDHAYDLEGFKRLLSSNTRLIWLCNPNNPTGSFFTAEEFADFLQAVPPETLVVYDEAYQEFAVDPAYPHNSLDYLDRHRNLLILKTFSKAYGLAGMRIGFALGDPQLLALINKIRNPFNVTRLTQAAALAALDDEGFVAKTVENNQHGKLYLYAEFDKAGIEYVKTEANYIMFNCERDAEAVFGDLLAKGVIVRPVGGAKYKTWIRVSIGTMAENREFIQALQEVLR